jgi:hypothetical protein
MGDFIVRAGNIMVATTSYKGILIEVGAPSHMFLQTQQFMQAAPHCSNKYATKA